MRHSEIFSNLTGKLLRAEVRELIRLTFVPGLVQNAMEKSLKDFVQGSDRIKVLFGGKLGQK
jgi:hypothetical protein